VLSIVGAIVFMAAGMFDFWWHITFGFGVNVETLVGAAVAADVLLAVCSIMGRWWRRWAPGGGSTCGWASHRRLARSGCS
jgi:hypothetical protein